MKLLVLYQYYKDQASPGHSLIYELTQHLAEKGHEVTVVSGETGYMQNSDNALPWYRRLVRVERVGAVRVIRTFTYSDMHRGYLGRMLSFLSFSLSCPLGIIKAGPVDVALASSPPIFPVFVAWLVCTIKRTPFVLEVRDLWPASAVQMGILKSRILIGLMGWMERTLYQKSSRIIALTEGIRSDICSRGWSEEKVELVTCGVDFDHLYPDSTTREVTRNALDWADKTVVLYFGALGEANNIPVILRTAKRLEHHSDILFVLVGNGIKRRATELWLNETRITNVQMLPAVPKTSAREYICAADICLATLLDIPLFDGAIPTKLIDYMACAQPVLCGIRGEAQRIVEDSGAGHTFEPDSDEELAARVLEMSSDVEGRKTMGVRGLAYVHERFSADDMRQQAEALLVAVSGAGSNKTPNGTHR
jgi:glycosyltransferase involved in cell wall biosynthesis